MTEFIFVEKLEGDGVIYSSDLFYDLFDGGYIKPEDMLEEPEQIADLYDAIKLIKDFLDQAQQRGHLEVI